MAFDRLLAFALTALVLIAIPGPSVLFTISRALTIGRRGALLTVVGNAAGGYLQVVTVPLGVGVLVERSVELFTGLKLVGAAYPILLGVQAVRHRRSSSDALAGQPAPTRVTLQLLALGAIFYVVAVVCDGLWAIAAGSARVWLARSPSRLEAIGGAVGVAMIGLGASLALTGRKS